MGQLLHDKPPTRHRLSRGDGGWPSKRAKTLPERLTVGRLHPARPQFAAVDIRRVEGARSRSSATKTVTATSSASTEGLNRRFHSGDRPVHAIFLPLDIPRGQAGRPSSTRLGGVLAPLFGVIRDPVCELAGRGGVGLEGRARGS